MTDLLMATAHGTVHLTDNETLVLLRELHSCGVTYQSVANLLGVNWRTIHRWSRGETRPTLPGLVCGVLEAQLRHVRAVQQSAAIDAEEAARQPVGAV